MEVQKIQESIAGINNIKLRPYHVPCFVIKNYVHNQDDATAAKKKRLESNEREKEQNQPNTTA